ncbi:hypothetical protein [Flavobacterium sp. J27]|uniref:hypothetical protein n=1 Tax=Flavobacterium sp. J27 TaxID=2060419 RepID=UPI001031E46F|nr:hypothetical protein [Flavobacterium sp. J27]
MKKIIFVWFLMGLILVSCSKDDDTTTNTEDFSKYHATWILSAKKDADDNTIAISGCENGRNKIVLDANGNGSFTIGNTIYNGNGFVCGENTEAYKYTIANSKMEFKNSDETYKMTYEIISVNETTLVVKKISVTTNGTETTITNIITETYTKQVL